MKRDTRKILAEKRVRINGYLSSPELEAIREEWQEEEHSFEDESQSSEDLEDTSRETEERKELETLLEGKGTIKNGDY